MDKFELLEQIILSLNRIADATGVERCALLVNAVKMAGALKDNLAESDKAVKAREALLLQQIEAQGFGEPGPGDEVLGGQTYEIKFGEGIENGGNNTVV
jgi:hypothetical protein